MIRLRPRLAAPLLLCLLLLPEAAFGQIPRDKEAEAARRTAELKAAGRRAEEVRDLLQREFRALPTDIARLLGSAGYRDPEVAGSVAGLFRGDLDRTAGALREARWDVRRVAAGLRGFAVREPARRLADALAVGGFPAGELADVVQTLFLADAEGATQWMLEAGWDPTLAARQLRIQYRLDAGATASIMLDAGWPLPGVAGALADQWPLHPDELVVVLMGASSSSVVGILSAMANGGVPVPVAERVRYEAVDTRWGSSGMRVDDGVVNRNWIVDPDPTDGVLWLVGHHLQRPGVRFFLGNVEGEIRSVAQEGPMDRMELFFPSTANGPSALTLRTLWNGVQLNGDPGVPPRGYDAFHNDDLSALSGASWIVLGDPPGGGRIESEFGAPEEFELDPFDIMGTSLEITGLSTSPLEMTFASPSDPSWDAALSLEGELIATGPEAFKGEFFDQIPCWVCQGYEVPEADCGALDLPCFLAELGTNLGGLGAWCANPANWERRNLARGPAIPFTGQVQNGRIRLLMGLEAVDGHFRVPGVQAEFQGQVLLTGAPPGLTGGMVEDWLEAQISQNLAGAVEESVLPGALEAGLTQLAAFRGWAGHLASMTVLPNGVLRLDLGR